MGFLAHKTVRTALAYVALCALALGFARWQRLALCADWRFAALREEMRSGEPADVLFLGSSRTSRGVRPLVFEEALAELGRGPLRAVNLGVMGFPRQVDYLLLSDWLRDHPAPEAVFVEVGDVDLADRPHEALSRFMGPRDALRLALRRPYRAEDGEMLQRWSEDPEGALDRLLRSTARGAFHLELALDALGRGPEDVVRWTWNHLRNGWERGLAPDGLGFPYWAAPPAPPIARAPLLHQLEHHGWYQLSRESGDWLNGKAEVAARASRVAVDGPLERRYPQDVLAPDRYRFLRLYGRLLSDLCRRHGIRLVFFHLPGFRQRDLSESQEALYESLGELYRPDRRALSDEALYQDPGHLSDEGAAWYTRRLAEWYAAGAD